MLWCDWEWEEHAGARVEIWERVIEVYDVNGRLAVRL